MKFRYMSLQHVSRGSGIRIAFLRFSSTEGQKSVFVFGFVSTLLLTPMFESKFGHLGILETVEKDSKDELFEEVGLLMNSVSFLNVFLWICK